MRLPTNPLDYGPPDEPDYAMRAEAITPDWLAKRENEQELQEMVWEVLEADGATTGDLHQLLLTDRLEFANQLHARLITRAEERVAGKLYSGEIQPEEPDFD